MGYREVLEPGRIGSWQKPPEETEPSFRHIGEREGEICRQEETAAVGVVDIRVIDIIPRGRQFRAGVEPLVNGIAEPLHPDDEEDQVEDYSCVPSHGSHLSLLLHCVRCSA